jgi:hypothetical protein
LISAIQLKTKQKSYFEALTKKNYRSSFWVYKDEDGTYPAVKSLSEIENRFDTYCGIDDYYRIWKGLLLEISRVPPKS